MPDRLSSLYLATAIEAVIRAGDVQMQHFGREIRIDKKGAIDLVTEIDLQVEREFRAMITDRFRDAWAVNGGDPGYTSGQNETLTNPVSTLDQRIDFVFFKGRWRARTVEAHVVGDVPFRPLTQAWPIWPSDHAGVVATLRLR